MNTNACIINSINNDIAAPAATAAVIHVKMEEGGMQDDSAASSQVIMRFVCDVY